MTRSPKKSETLEIRLSLEAKQIFMARCRAEGRSASETLRRFIEQGEAAPAKRSSRRGLRLLTGLIVVAVTAAALPSLAHPGARAEFDSMDLDHDGRIDLGEFVRSAEVAVSVEVAGAAVVRRERGGVLPVAYMHDPRGQAEARLARQVLADSFAGIDRNRDGAISFEEFRAAQR